MQCNAMFVNIMEAMRDPHQMYTRRNKKRTGEMRVYRGLVGPSQFAAIRRWEYLYDSAFESIEQFQIVMLGILHGII